MSDHEAHTTPSDPALSDVDYDLLLASALPTTPSALPPPRLKPTLRLAFVLIFWFLGTLVVLCASGAIQEATMAPLANTRLEPATLRWGMLVLFTPILTCFTCTSLYLAFGGYSLLIRFGVGLMIAVLAIAFMSGVFLLLSGMTTKLQDVARPFIAFSYSMMAAGALLSIARFAGWSFRCHRSPQTPSSQYSIFQILQLTLICALGFGATNWVELTREDWKVIGMTVASIIGLSVAITFLMIDHGSVAVRTIATILLIGVLLVALWSCISFLTNTRRIDLRFLVLMSECYLTAFNFLAMICFVLRARGYRLTRKSNSKA